MMPAHAEPHVILFASGKGGVGKSTLSAAMAKLVAQQGKRVLLIDGDVGLRSLDLMLGMQDSVLYEMADCLARRCSLDDAIRSVPSAPGLSLLMAGQQAKPREFAGKDIDKVFRTLKQRFDVIMIDGPAGLGRGLRNWAEQANRLVLVATADDVCLRDTEKTARLLMDTNSLRAQLLINRLDERLVRRGLLSNPSVIAQTIDLELLGVIPQSDAVYPAMLAGETAGDTQDRQLTEALRRTAVRLMGALDPWQGHETFTQRLRKLFRKEVRHA